MPRIAFVVVVIVAWFALPAAAAEPMPPFSQTLSLEQKQRLGLAHLSPAQLAELDATIAGYTRGATTAVERQAEQKAAVAAETAVADYRKTQEPGVVARTLEKFKRKQEEEKRARFSGRVIGDFRGWSGGTYFPLDNGQVWRQVGAENNELPPMQNAQVEIYRAASGYWRLTYGGAWITVKRLQ